MRARGKHLMNRKKSLTRQRLGDPWRRPGSRVPYGGPVHFVAVSADGRRVASASLRRRRDALGEPKAEWRMRLLDAATGQLVHTESRAEP